MHVSVVQLAMALAEKKELYQRDFRPQKVLLMID
jgi:hypothetical protein